MASRKSVVEEVIANLAGEADVPAQFRPIYVGLVQLTDRFCDERLDEEFKGMCRKMAEALCQKGSPVVRGKRESWACGIVYSVGWVNFLQDPSLLPHVRAEEVYAWFGVSQATMHNKAKVLREGLDLVPFHPQWTVPSRMEHNPFAWLVEMNGVIVDIRELPPAAQQILVDKGVISQVHQGGAPREGQLGGELREAIDRVVYKTHANQNAATSDDASGLPTRDAYQMKVTLDNVKPGVWRRFRVVDMTLEELHDVIQCVMGWDDTHLHEFRFGDERITMDAARDDLDYADQSCRSESDVFISDLIDEGCRKLHYWYDFGDDWWHTIKIEKTIQVDLDDAEAFCVAGEGACPPEDCGGPWGYAQLVEAIADPGHERHEEFIEWFDGAFDPSHFSLGKVNRELAEMMNEEEF